MVCSPLKCTLNIYQCVWHYWKFEEISNICDFCYLTMKMYEAINNDYYSICLHILCFFFFQELREIHNRQQLQKQKNLEAERLKQKEQERKTELEKQKEAQRQQSALVYTLSAEVLECKAFCKKSQTNLVFPRA